MSELESKMDKTIESMRQSFTTIRTGRASPDLLNKIKVEVYGSLLPIKQTASIHVQDSNVLVIQPFDRTTIGHIDRAIVKSDLGVNPVNDGVALRITIPPLTEERRKDLDKMIKKMAEEARIAIRNIRREAIDKIKKEKLGSEDEQKRHEHEIQKTTEKFIAMVEDLLKYKEKEIMEI